MGSSGFDFDEAKYVAVPADEVNFTPAPMRAVVARHHHISEAAKMKVSVFFAAPSGPLVRRSIVRRTNTIRNVVDCMDNHSNQPGAPFIFRQFSSSIQGSASLVVE